MRIGVHTTLHPALQAPVNAPLITFSLLAYESVRPTLGPCERQVIKDAKLASLIHEHASTGD